MDRSVRNLLLVALACAGGVAVLALLFYGSARFAELDVELTAMLLAPEGSRTEQLAQFAADLAGPGPLLLVCLGLLGLGLFWQRPWHLLAGGAVFLAANLTTQLLKLSMAHPRVQGALGVSYPIEIHYPSGHTTAALSAGFALWLLAPPRWRWQAAAFGAVYGGAVAAGVVMAGWHFITDVFGAALVVGFWACLALAALRMAGREGDGQGPEKQTGRAAGNSRSEGKPSNSLNES